MLFLFLGPDDFSKKEYIKTLALQQKAEVVGFSDEENFPKPEYLFSQDLFSKPKIFVLKGLLKHFLDAEVVEKFIASKNHIIIAEEKLDKRLTETKKLLSNKNISVKEFNLPHGLELNKWIEERVKILNGLIHPRAVEALAVALGRDDAKVTKFGGKIVDAQEIFSLWQADSEIKKLISNASGRPIREEDIFELASVNREVDVFELTNAIAENNKQKSLNLLHEFLKIQTGSDEKGSVIQLNALLSEQFRNVKLVQEFLREKRTEDQILEATGWKSGRVFIMKKIADRFQPKKITEFLQKLAALDEELKTSQTPPKVLLDLVVSQLLI